MLGSNQPLRVPSGVPPAQQQWMRRTNVQLEQMGRLQGVGINGGTLPTEVVAVPQFITGQIRLEGSGSGSGSFSLDPAGAGFTDEDGYLAYAFDQTLDDRPWKGIVIVGGISTVLPNSGSGSGSGTPAAGSNYAYPLNGETWEEGANVLLKRAGNHWIIVGGLGEASGSGSGGGIPIYCDGVLSGRVTVSGSTVSVTTL